MTIIENASDKDDKITNTNDPLESIMDESY